MIIANFGFQNDALLRQDLLDHSLYFFHFVALETELSLQIK